MTDLYKTCKIEAGKFTLIEIAAHFDLNPEELRWFHNQFCPLDDLIDPDLKAHVNIIYVPIPNQETGFYKTTVRKKPLYKKPFALSIPNSFQKKYGIVQVLYKEDQEKQKLHYELQLSKTGSSNLSVQRTSFFKNEKKPEKTMDSLADEVGGVFYPLELELYNHARLKHISNFPYIQKRWKIKQQQLSSYYKGKVADDFFHKINHQFENRRNMQRGILDSWFYVLYFFPLYESFNEDKKYKFQMTLPFFPKKKKIPFDIVLSLDEQISDTQKFCITAKGKCSESQQADEVFKDEASKKQMQMQGNLEIIFTLNAKDNTIASIIGELSIETYGKRKKIAFECYELFS